MNLKRSIICLGIQSQPERLKGKICSQNTQVLLAALCKMQCAADDLYSTQKKTFNQTDASLWSETKLKALRRVLDARLAFRGKTTKGTVFYLTFKPEKYMYKYC